MHSLQCYLIYKTHTYLKENLNFNIPLTFVFLFTPCNAHKVSYLNGLVSIFATQHVTSRIQDELPF